MNRYGAQKSYSSILWWTFSFGLFTGEFCFCALRRYNFLMRIETASVLKLSAVSILINICAWHSYVFTLIFGIYYTYISISGWWQNTHDSYHKITYHNPSRAVRRREQSVPTAHRPRQCATEATRRAPASPPPPRRAADAADDYSEARSVDRGNKDLTSPFSQKLQIHLPLVTSATVW